MKYILLFVSLCLSSCTSVPSGNLNSSSELPPNLIASHLYEMAKRCWDKKDTAAIDGKGSRLEEKPNGGYVVSFYTYARDYNGMSNPDITVNIDAGGKNSLIILNLTK